MKSKPPRKTNALRLLDSRGIRYETASYDSGGVAVDAATVAQKIGMPPEQVFKTLIAVGPSTGPVAFVVPGDCELDLRKAAAASGNKKIEMLPLRELKGLTGYERGGCSPVGMARPLPTWIDESVELFETVAVSAGAIGLQMILAPADLIEAAQASLADLS
ncbi:MAG: Cys-tRNA(Pro) deacylase [Acidobacteria bacterium]|nr:Cys-tRNA(Pro) deacylase [Acidobacteriota bacterium]